MCIRTFGILRVGRGWLFKHGDVAFSSHFRGFFTCVQKEIVNKETLQSGRALVGSCLFLLFWEMSDGKVHR